MNSHNYENNYPSIDYKTTDLINQSEIEDKLSAVKHNIWHKLIDCINISLLIFIFILSFLSFDSQRKWTNYYSSIQIIRSINNKLIDYSSQTEEYYLKEIDSLEQFRTTTTKDLIYLSKQFKKDETNLIKTILKQLHKGLREGVFQRGY